MCYWIEGLAINFAYGQLQIQPFCINLSAVKYF